jgi:hypothetical protein
MHPGGEQRYRVAEEGFLRTTLRHRKPHTDRDVVTCSLPINSVLRRDWLSAALDFNAGRAVGARNVVESPIWPHGNRLVAISKGRTGQRYVSVEVFGHDNLHRGLSGTTKPKGLPDEE